MKFHKSKNKQLFLKKTNNEDMKIIKKKNISRNHIK